jgi:hypothetical protein
MRWAIVLVLAVGCGGGGAGRTTSAGGDIDAALDLFAKGDLAGAEANVRDRRDVDSIRLRARILMMQNRNREAIELLLPLAPQRGQKVKTYEAMESQNAVLPDLAVAYVRQDDFRNAGAVYHLIGEAILAKKYEALARVVAYSSNVGSEEIAVPFEFLDPVPVVAGSVNGKRALFAIDTLTDQLTLSRTFARRAGIEAIGLRGSGSFDEATAAEVGLGRVTVTNVPIHLGDPFDTGRQAVDGVVGLQFLMHFDFTLDYRRGRLVLRKAGGALPGGQPAFIAGDRYLLMGALVNGKDKVFVGLGTSLRGVTLAASEMALQGAPIAEFSAGPIKLVKPALEFKAFPQGLDGAFGIPVGFVLGHSALKGRILRLEPVSMKLLIE